MAGKQERSLEDINYILQLAKLTENDIMPLSQTLYFTEENLHNNNYKLLELDRHLMEELTPGKTLYIKGDDDEHVVLCTDTRTYDVVATETSNSLLLTTDIKFSGQVKEMNERAVTKSTVCGIFYEYLEVISSKPHLRKLKALLDKIPYKGPEHEYEVNKAALLTYDDLLEKVQASEKELKEALAQMDVVTIDDKIRILDFEYHFRVLSYMLKLIDENSWKLDEIDYEETISALQDLVPRQILESIFDKYTTESKVVDGLQLYRYKEHKVCQFFAQVLLQYAEKFNLEEFLTAWQESVPEGMKVDEEMLYGIAIIDRKSNPNVIRAFSEEDLPENIDQRLNILFQVKEKWTIPEIAPYIKRLTTDKLDVNALLAKHARASKIDGVKYYSAKHSK